MQQHRNSQTMQAFPQQYPVQQMQPAQYYPTPNTYGAQQYYQTPSRQYIGHAPQSQKNVYYQQRNSIQQQQPYLYSNANIEEQRQEERIQHPRYPVYQESSSPSASVNNERMSEQAQSPHHQGGHKMQTYKMNERLGFIRKVYSLIFIQLFITMLFCILSFQSHGFMMFQVVYWPLFVLALIGCICIEIAIFCKPQITWKTPNNYIILFGYTYLMSWVVSSICSFVYYTKGEDGAFAVMIAAVLSVVIVSALTAYALYTKTDFTTKGSALWMCSIALLFFGIFASIFYTRALYIFYGFLCVLLLGFYIIYDTQLIIGGKTHAELSVDDFVIGSIIIYGDIVIARIMD